MKRKPDIACIVLAGGASKRFGHEKGLADFHGRPLIAHVVEKLREQTLGIVGVNAPFNSLYARWADMCLPDLLGERLGPLAGLHAALHWGREHAEERVVTCAVDTPLLPEKLVEQLSAMRGAAIARSFGRTHPICGIWPTTLLPDLQQFLESGERAAYKWAQACGAEEIEFGRGEGFDPFFNINTTADLSAATKL